MAESFKTRYQIAKARETALREIAALQVAADRSWEGIRPTAKTCECCGQTYYPQGPPEWDAYVEAARALDHAIFSAVDGGTIPINVAAARFDKTPRELKSGADWVRLVREREDGDTTGIPGAVRREASALDRAQGADQAPASDPGEQDDHRDDKSKLAQTPQ